MNRFSAQMPRIVMDAREKDQRDKICISISEGCIRHYKEDPEIEEQFILRLPEADAEVVSKALENDTLGNRLSICIEKNHRDASVILDGKKINGKIMDLPTIIESYKLADESTFYKTADISQVLDCSVETAKKIETATNLGKNKDKQYEYSMGLCPPLKNARKKRFRKVQLEENFDPGVDRAVKLLLRADGAAESVRYELVYEDEPESSDKPRTDNDENNSAIDDTSSVFSASNEVDVFGETLSMSSDDDDVSFNHNDGYESTTSKSDIDSDFDPDIGNIENYDFETITEEQKQCLAHLKEIDWCLSNYDFKTSPPRQSTRGRGSGRGRGRPRMHSKPPRKYKIKPPNHVSMAGRGGRGRPPGRGRGHMHLL